MVQALLQSRHSATKASVACYSRYHSDTAVAQYCDAHYGPDKFGVTNFSKQIAQLCVVAQEGNPQRSALDLGCSVGRTTFELATSFDHVTGIDYSTRFIDIAHRIKTRGKICYQLPEEGDLISDHEVSLSGFGLAETSRRVTFSQGDALCLQAHFRDYDLVLAANLIDRLLDPGKFLANIHQRLEVGGLLVIASPYNWLEHFTPKKQWLSSRSHAGSTRTSLEGIGKKLSKHFIIVGEPQEVAFVVRETARTFHHSISQVTLWRRIS